MKPTAGRVRLVPIRALLVATAFALCATSGWAKKYELLQPIPELQLKSGTILHAVTFVSVGPASITGKWDGGLGTIPLTLLPDEVRADLVPAVPQKPAPAPSPAPHSDVARTAGPTKLPTEIKLTNGFIMQEAKVVSWQADGMTVEYVGGKVPVKFENVSPEQRMIFETRKTEMFAERARMDATRAAQRAGSPGGPSADDMRALIKSGIAAHQLVIGMTRPEVVEAIGMPDGVQDEPTNPDVAYWLYRGRGRKADGAPCDRVVGFDKGIMGGWKDIN